MKTNRVQRELTDDLPNVRFTLSSDAGSDRTVSKTEQPFPRVPRLRLQTTSLSSIQPQSFSPDHSNSNLSLRESRKRNDSPCSSAPLSARNAITPRGIPIRSCRSLAGTAPASPATPGHNPAPSEPLFRDRRFTLLSKREAPFSQDNVSRGTNSHSNQNIEDMNPMRPLWPHMHKQAVNNPISQAQTSQSPDYSVLSPALHNYQQTHLPSPSTPRFQLTEPHLKLTPDGQVSPQALVQILGGPVNLSCNPAILSEQIKQLRKIKEELERAASSMEQSTKEEGIPEEERLSADDLQKQEEKEPEESASQSQPLTRRQNQEQENVDTTEAVAQST